MLQNSDDYLYICASLFCSVNGSDLDPEEPVKVEEPAPTKKPSKEQKNVKEMPFITSDEFNGILVYMKSHLTYCQINDVIKEINKAGTSLVAQWLASTCRCRGHGFDPWFGKIPHAMEQLSPCATTTEPVL